MKIQKKRSQTKKMQLLAQIGIRRAQQKLQGFFATASAEGLSLLFWVILALILANTGAGNILDELFSTAIKFQIGDFMLQESLKTWIDDGLMAIFFLLVGLEIKRELLYGSLSSFKKAIVPVASAFGGALMPAIIYLLFNLGSQTQSGWGIPMATDIAFALAVISMLGDRIPIGLKIFLAALAIVDDLIAIAVIGLFYSSELYWDYLLIGILLFVCQLGGNKLGIKSLWFYLPTGMLLWYAIHHSGIHATIAGVLTAIAIPTKGRKNQLSPSEYLEHKLNKPVTFLIVPLFAFANTAIQINGEMLSGLTSKMGLGISVGLLVGKTLGIFGTSWLLCKCKLATLPEKTTWKQMIGVGILGGIGFTMSIFISMLSFSDPNLIEEAKLSILITSVSAGLLGYIYLKSTTQK